MVGPGPVPSLFPFPPQAQNPVTGYALPAQLEPRFVHTANLSKLAGRPSRGECLPELQQQGCAAAESTFLKCWEAGVAFTSALRRRCAEGHGEGVFR